MNHFDLLYGAPPTNRILKGNKLGANLGANMFNHLDRMNMIDLSDNEITFIPPGLFKVLWKMRVL